MTALAAPPLPPPVNDGGAQPLLPACASGHCSHPDGRQQALRQPSSPSSLLYRSACDRLPRSGTILTARYASHPALRRSWAAHRHRPTAIAAAAEPLQIATTAMAGVVWAALKHSAKVIAATNALGFAVTAVTQVRFVRVCTGMGGMLCKPCMATHKPCCFPNFAGPSLPSPTFSL